MSLHCLLPMSRRRAAAFGLGNGLSTTTVAGRTFNTVDLVGRPLALGHFVALGGLPGLVFTTRTNTYTPYLQVGDDAFPDSRRDGVFTGRPYQVTYTNFPLGTQVATGLFPGVTLLDPRGGAQTATKELADRIGLDVRRNGGTPTTPFSPDAPPLVSPYQGWSLGVLAARQLPTTRAALERQLQADYLAVADADPAAPGARAVATTRALVTQTRDYLNALHGMSGFYSDRLAAVSRVAAYHDRPRLTVVSSNLTAEGGAGGCRSRRTCSVTPSGPSRRRVGRRSPPRRTRPAGGCSKTWWR